jgi:hypothetical protein
MKFKLSVLSLAVSLAFTGSALAQSIATVDQSGSGNYAGIDQNTASTANAAVSQNGNNNRVGDSGAASAGITQTNLTGFSDANVSQGLFGGVLSENNSATVNQSNSSAVRTDILQQGLGNTADSTQGSVSNIAAVSITQDGDGNVAAAAQSAAAGGTVATITQTGNAQRATVTQGAVGATTAAVNQSGGPDNAVDITQSTSQGVAANVSQSGDNNQAFLTQTGSASSSAATDQIGSSNLATVQQTAATDSGAGVIQDGTQNSATVEQFGLRQQASVMQNAGSDQAQAHVIQSNGDNTANVLQIGVSRSGAVPTSAVVTQTGARNLTFVTQEASQGVTANVVQAGSDAAANVDQTASVNSNGTIVQNSSVGGFTNADIIQNGARGSDASITQSNLDNTATINQFGTVNSSGTIGQSGDNNFGTIGQDVTTRARASLLQNGDGGNTADIGQTNAQDAQARVVQERLAPGGGHEARVTQTDSSNISVTVVQNNGAQNLATVEQVSALNSGVDVTQNRSFGTVRVFQGRDSSGALFGTEDAFATVTQRGGDQNVAGVFQYGTGPGLTSATVEQVGSSNLADVGQGFVSNSSVTIRQGDVGAPADRDNSASVTQFSGNDLNSSVTQTGFEHVANVLQEGAWNETNILQSGSGSQATVFQSGAGVDLASRNLASITQGNVGHGATVAQLGMGNTAIINQQ